MLATVSRLSKGVYLVRGAEMRFAVWKFLLKIPIFIFTITSLCIYSILFYFMSYILFLFIVPPLAAWSICVSPPGTWDPRLGIFTFFFFFFKSCHPQSPRLPLSAIDLIPPACHHPHHSTRGAGGGLLHLNDNRILTRRPKCPSVKVMPRQVCCFAFARVIWRLSL